MEFKSFKNLPKRLSEKIQALQLEDDAYAADELVELGEEILSQLAAMGIAVYLKQGKQKEVFNDFLISLFLSKGHAYNAGPLFRWAANMIKDAEGEEAKMLMPFFWQNENGHQVLNEPIHHLASLRNAVMHGFFVLPPERNRIEARKMEVILEQLTQESTFEKNMGPFHFIDENGFNGHWNIVDIDSWNAFDSQFPFGQLASRVAHEYSPGFRKGEEQFAQDKIIVNEKLTSKINDILKKGKGAMVAWYRPEDENGIYAYRQFVQELDLNQYHCLNFALHPTGVTYTSSFLENEISKRLFELTNNEKARKDPWKFLKANKGKLPRKIVVVLHDVHIALFSPNHLLTLINSLYEAEVPVFATSWHYPYLQRFFNSTIALSNQKQVSNTDLIQFSLINYLRFKGPNSEQESEHNAFQQLQSIVSKLLLELSANKSIVARRFSDQYGFPIEFVHEAIAILSPFFNLTKEVFLRDEVDEQYGFPISIEESSRIFLSLGRRDVKLEYKHLVIS